MTYKWTSWKPPEVEGRDPYIDWALGPGEERIFDANTEELDDGDNVKLVATHKLLEMGPRAVFKELDQIVVPKVALNANADGTIKVEKPEFKELPSGTDTENSTTISKETIIAGVIDVGMALGHRRLRFANGKTRLLSAWQMVGNWDLKKQKKIPFGCEFYEHEINDKLREFSDGDLQGSLDEDTFHKELGILNLNQVSRQTSLAKRTSHGAHVLDMVAGADPEEEKTFAERVRIIAINMASSTIFGASGTYLDSYMLHAIQRITDVSDSLWEKLFADEKINGKKGFPIVINLSFGKHAGAKSTLDRFAAAIQQLSCARRVAGKSRLDIVMPTGNDNLARCNAYLQPAKNNPTSLNWQIQPQDQSSNYTELWLPDLEPKQVDGKPKVLIKLTTPSGKTPPLLAPKLGHGHTIFSTLECDGTVVAHLYLTRVSEKNQLDIKASDKNGSKKSEPRYRYILCTVPTFRLDASQTIAESGTWVITLESTNVEPIRVVLSVQTDQSLLPNRSINRRSYFDHSEYVTHAPDGSLLESYGYPKNNEGKFKNLDIQADTPVRRHGTMNASAAHGAVARVGGYRASDGRPAFYSSTGRGRTSGNDGNVEENPALGKKGTARAPTAAFPTDDGPAHGGILSAGTVDGSRVIMRGTSFASSQAARLVISEWLEGRERSSANSILFTRAAKHESSVDKIAPKSLTYEAELIEVVGRGRIQAPQQHLPRRVIKGPFDG